MVGGCPAELTTDINSPPSLSNLGHFTILPPAPISSDRSGFTTHRVDDVPGTEEGEGLDVDRCGEEEERAEHDRCVHHWPHQTPQLSPHLYLYLTRTAVVLCALGFQFLFWILQSQFAHVYSGSPPSSDWRGGRWRARQRFLGTVPSSCHRATAPVEEERSRCVFSRGRPALPAPPEQRYTRREPPVIRLLTLNFNVELLHQPSKRKSSTQ